MPAVNYNFVIEQGSDFTLSFKYNDANGNPVNLSGKCVVIQWQAAGISYNFSSLANSFYEIDGYSMTSDDSGTIIFKLSAGITRNFNFDTALYDLDIRETNGGSLLSNIRLCTGTITLLKRNFSLPIDCPTGQAIKDNNITPTPTAPTETLPSGITPTPTNTSTQPQFEDLCLPDDCINLDIYSTVYTGGRLIIPDLATVSGTVSTTDTRQIENIELAINKLQHQNPSDLIFLLNPPSGNKILLSANNKIPSYNNNFSFMFSNKAASGDYLYNINNGGICKINNKSNLINYNNESLLYSFDHLLGASLTGDWTLIAKDTDPLGSGIVDSWKLIITYIPIIDENPEEQ